MQGRISKYDKEKGFGWIKIETRLALQFFHVSHWNHSEVPVIGQLVEFGLAPDRQGRIQATNVTIIDPKSAEVAPVATATETSNAGVK